MLAPAKLNLFLRVVRRRDDGFHDLETVMTAINLFDTLQFESCDTSEISLRVVMSSSRNSQSSPVEAIPTGPDNLVLRAACLLREYAGATQGARITLIKRIPSAAGMGGGSSDAAATLAGLNRFWNLMRTRAELLDLAAQLGSDVGFFLDFGADSDERLGPLGRGGVEGSGHDALDRDQGAFFIRCWRRSTAGRMSGARCGGRRWMRGIGKLRLRHRDGFGAPFQCDPSFAVGQLDGTEAIVGHQLDEFFQQCDVHRAGCGRGCRRRRP